MTSMNPVRRRHVGPIAWLSALGMATSLVALPFQAPVVSAAGEGVDVILGDSYISGEGLGNDGGYFASDDLSNIGETADEGYLAWNCHRHPSAAALRALLPVNSGTSPDYSTVRFFACSGDEINQMRSRTTESKDAHPIVDVNGDGIDDASQFERLRNLTRDGFSVDRIIFSGGGNDLGFEQALRACVFNAFRVIGATDYVFGSNGSISPDCLTSLDFAKSQLTPGANPLVASSFEERLVSVYTELLEAAPQASLTVQNYPKLFPETDQAGTAVVRDAGANQYQVCVVADFTVAGGGFRKVISKDAVQRINQLQFATNRAVAAAVARTAVAFPGRIQLVDLFTPSAAHPVSCGASGRPTPWMNAGRVGVTGELSADAQIADSSFHPNADGAAAYEVLIREALNRPTPFAEALPPTVFRRPGLVFALGGNEAVYVDATGRTRPVHDVNLARACEELANRRVGSPYAVTSDDERVSFSAIGFVPGRVDPCPPSGAPLPGAPATGVDPLAGFDLDDSGQPWWTQSSGATVRRIADTWVPLPGDRVADWSRVADNDVPFGLRTQDIVGPLRIDWAHDSQAPAPVGQWARALHIRGASYVGNQFAGPGSIWWHINSNVGNGLEGSWVIPNPLWVIGVAIGEFDPVGRPGISSMRLIKYSTRDRTAQVLVDNFSGLVLQSTRPLPLDASWNGRYVVAGQPGGGATVNPFPGTPVAGPVIIDSVSGFRTTADRLLGPTGLSRFSGRTVSFVDVSRTGDRVRFFASAGNGELAGTYELTPGDDGDVDGFGDSVDNCPTVSNADQLDTDFDGVGDACEAPLDTEAPVVTATLAPAPNEAGWSNAQPVTVTWSVVDAASAGGVLPAPPPVEVAAEGESVIESAEVCDAAGNCARGSVTVNIDVTPPEIDLPATIVLQSTGSSGVVFAGLSGFSSDAVSGVLTETCSIPVGTRLGHGYHDITCRSVDLAGNQMERNRRLLVVGPDPGASGLGPVEQSPVPFGDRVGIVTSDGASLYHPAPLTGLGLHELATDERTPVSISDEGVERPGTMPESVRPISTNGRFVIFESGFTGMDDDRPTIGEFYIRDTLSGDTIALPIAASEVVGVSNDGQRVLFWSDAVGVVPNPLGVASGTRYRSVYIWDRTTNHTTELNPGRAGIWSNGDASGMLSRGIAGADLDRVVVQFGNSLPRVIEVSTGRSADLPLDSGAYDAVRLSANGRWAAVVTSASLVPSDVGPVPDAYRLDVDDLLSGGDGNPVLASDRTEPVFPDNIGNCLIGDVLQVCHGVSSGYTAEVSDDGNTVAFTSAISHDAARDFMPSLSADVYVRDIANGVTTLVSHDPAGGLYGNTGTELVGMARDGSRLVMRAGSRYVMRSLTPADVTAPAVSGVVSPVVNGAGWHRSAVVVSWLVDDPSASVPAPVMVSAEGAGQVVVSEPSCDLAGNCATGSVTLSIDVTSPTAVAAPSPVANAANWNNTPVTVWWSCGDNLSGVVVCPEPTTLGEGAGQDVSHVISDVAGNSITSTYSQVNIDLTAPTLTGVPVQSPNAAGWFSDDVTVAWSCADALSGIDGGCPADGVIGGEGVGLTVSASVSDVAGNSTSSVSAGVDIDRTAPVTTADVMPGWSASDVFVSLVAGDNLSGVAETWFELDGGAARQGTQVAIFGSGVHTLRFWSVDVAGNVEAASTVTVLIDAAAPTITGEVSPAANAAGWHREDVTVSFTCSAGVSGVASCTSPVVVSAEGEAQPVNGTVVSNAGLSASTTVEVSIDKTVPVVSAATAAAANAAGWYREDVTVSFTCVDSLSGVASCPSDVTLSGDGVDRSVSGVAVDAAGNEASASLAGIDIDQTAPSISGSTNGAPNAAGWYRGPVTVSFVCADALSGVASCPAPTTLTGDGLGQSVAGEATDAAGSTAGATVSGINIDATPPVVALSVVAGAVSCTATDAVSGVAGGCVLGAPVQLGGGQVQVTATAVDVAGNVGTGSITYTVLGDRQLILSWAAQLQALTLTGDADDARDDAVDELLEAATAGWWNAAGTAPSGNQGGKVFKAIADALDELADINGNATVDSIETTLVSTARNWAVAEINAAIARGASASKIAQAQNPLAGGDTATNPEAKVDAYGKAWDRAVKA